MTEIEFIQKLAEALKSRNITLYYSDSSIKHPEQVIEDILASRPILNQSLETIPYFKNGPDCTYSFELGAVPKNFFNEDSTVSEFDATPIKANFPDYKAHLEMSDYVGHALKKSLAYQNLMTKLRDSHK